jgi:hypothetical protein
MAHNSFDPPAEADWHRRIAEAAYLLAERRGFRGGEALQDWLTAEAAIRDSMADVDLPKAP